MVILPNTWKAVLKNGSWQVLDGKEQLICTLANSKDGEANARLIALAPYMKEALQGIADLIGDEDLPDNGESSGAAICDMVRSAII